MRVQNNMTRSVYTVDPDTGLDEAFDLMKEAEIRHLPVVEGRTVVGILTERDILLRATQNDDSIDVPGTPVHEGMTTNVATCHPKSNIADVAAMMVEAKIGCLPVVSGGELVGLVTSTDLLSILSTWKDQTNIESLPFQYELHRYAGRQAASRPWA